MAQNQFPCKHFYAVFNTFDEWNFSRLPKSYRNNVFITLDPDVVDSTNVDRRDKPQAQQQVNCDDGASKGNEEDDTYDQDDFLPLDENRSLNELQEPKCSLTSFQKSVREKTARVCNTSYTVHNIECLKEAVQDLKRIYENLRNHSPRENGLPSRISPVKKPLKVTTMDYHKVFHKKLPHRKRKISKPLKTKGDSMDLGSVFIDLTKVGNFIDFLLQSFGD